MTVDADGKLWVAHWQGGRVTGIGDRYTAATVQLPVSLVAACQFGGSAFETHITRRYPLNQGSPATPCGGIFCDQGQGFYSKYAS